MASPARLLACAGVLAAALALAEDKHFSKDFSAELWTGRSATDSGAQMAKVYASGAKVRFDLVGEHGQAMIGIADLNAHETTMLMPSQKIAMVLPEGKDVQAHDTAFAASKNAFDPSEWDPATGPCAKSKTRTCKKLGDEKHDGRPASKWEMTFKKPDGGSEKATVWVDDALHLPLENRNESGRWVKMIHVQEAAQPAELFAIPSGYQMLGTPGR